MRGSWFKKLSLVMLCAVMLSACSQGDTGTNNAAGQAGIEVNANSGGAASGGTSGEGSAAAAAAAGSEWKATYGEDDLNAAWNADSATAIALNGSTISVSGSGASVEDAVATITAPGTYVLSGQLDNGQIVVDVADDGSVQLVLNGASIHNETSAAINVVQASKTVITLADGSENTVTDGEAYQYPDADTDEPDAAIFSKDDLTINGNGKLSVTGNYKDGIKAKDDLRIVSGTIEVQAADDGIKGRDMLAIRDGNISVIAESDALKTTNDEDTEKGWVSIEGGTFNLQAGNDGIQAENGVSISGGDFTIVAGGGSGSGATLTDDSPSMKGIKGVAEIWIGGGTINIDSLDDALHTNGSITIAGGELELATGDDGIHADEAVTITGGTIAIPRSYEGIEGAEITVSGGDISLVASDDGINIAGESQTASYVFTIDGGTIRVQAQGDGLDANGAIVMTGGLVIVEGPTGNGNGALDYDGKFEISGGTLFASGSAGMALATSDSSTQLGLMMTYPSAQQAGTVFHLQDSKGETIATYTPSKNYQTVFFSSPDLDSAETYTLYSGGSATSEQFAAGADISGYQGGAAVVSFSLATQVTWLNESGVTEARSGMGGPGGGFGGGRGGQGGRGEDGSGGMGTGGPGGMGGGEPPEGFEGFEGGDGTRPDRGNMNFEGGTPPEGGASPRQNGDEAAQQQG